MDSQLYLWKSKGAYFDFKGTSVFYIHEGIGEVLLILPGFPGSSYDFKEVLPTLANQYSVLLPDMPGMGFSEKPRDFNYSFSAYAEMYSALLKHVQIQEVHILTHDIGCNMAQELIARDFSMKNSFTIKSVAFLNGGLFADVCRPSFAQLLLSKSPRIIGSLVSSIITKERVDKYIYERFGTNTKPSDDLLDDFWNILTYNNGKNVLPSIISFAFEKTKHQQRWIHAMRKTCIPMCFINGPANPYSGMPMTKRYKELIPGSRIKILNKDIGHWPQLESPDEVINAYSKFNEILNEIRICSI